MRSNVDITLYNIKGKVQNESVRNGFRIFSHHKKETWGETESWSHLPPFRSIVLHYELSHVNRRTGTREQITIPILCFGLFWLNTCDMSRHFCSVSKVPSSVHSSFPAEQDLYGPDDVPTWDEFTQNTTFHGIRYVFDRTPFKCRRFVTSIYITLISFMAYFTALYAYRTEWMGVS